MKYCQNCRESFDVNSNLCPKCGKMFDITNKENGGDYNIKNPFLDIENLNNSVNNQDDSGLSSYKSETFNNLSGVSSSFVPDSQFPFVKQEQSVISKNESSDGLLFSNSDEVNTITVEEAKENLERLKKLNNPVLDFDPQKIKEQKEKEEKELEVKIKNNEKKQNRFISYTYIILAAIMLFLTIVPLIYDMQVGVLVHHLIIIVLLVISYKILPINKKVSYLTGFLSSVVMILTVIEKDYVTLVLGILLLIAEILSLFFKNNKLKSSI